MSCSEAKHMIYLSNFIMYLIVYRNNCGDHVATALNKIGYNQRQGTAKSRPITSRAIFWWMIKGGRYTGCLHAFKLSLPTLFCLIIVFLTVLLALYGAHKFD